MIGKKLPENPDKAFPVLNYGISKKNSLNPISGYRLMIELLENHFEEKPKTARSTMPGCLNRFKQGEKLEDNN